MTGNRYYYDTCTKWEPRIPGLVLFLPCLGQYRFSFPGKHVVQASVSCCDFVLKHKCKHIRLEAKCEILMPNVSERDLWYSSVKSAGINCSWNL